MCQMCGVILTCQMSVVICQVWPIICNLSHVRKRKTKSHRHAPPPSRLTCLTRYVSHVSCPIPIFLCHLLGVMLDLLNKKNNIPIHHCPLVRCHVSLVWCQVSHDRYYASCVRCHLSRILCHVSDVWSHLSDVWCHVSQVNFWKRHTQSHQPRPNQVSFIAC